MRKFVLFLLFPFALASALAHGSDAWWIICNSCTTDTQFRHAAREAPLDGMVFVSNGHNEVTQKFERLSIIEDAPGEIIVWISVIDVPISDAEAAVFNQALEKATVFLTSFRRDSIPGLDPVDSVLGDVQNGRLRAAFVQWLRAELMWRGHFPSPQSVSGQAGVTIGGITIQGSVTDQVRTNPLMVVITYPDGSRVTLTFSKDSESILEATVTDADDNDLPISGINSDGSIGLNRDGFMGREFNFGASASELLDWLNLASQIGEPICRVVYSEDSVTVICERN